MRRHNQQLPRNGSAMEIELTRQSSSTSDSDQPHIDPRFSGLQISRDNKRTSERQEIAEMRRQSRLSRTFSDVPLDDANETIPEEREPPHRQDSTESDGSQLQLLSPNRPEVSNAHDFSNWIENLGNTNEPQPVSENPHEPHMNPFSFLSNLFSGLTRLQRPSQPTNTNLPQQPTTEQTNPSNDALVENNNNIQNPFENNLGRFPNGAIIVRTVQPGPNGSIIVRMRVISLDELLGRHDGAAGAENSEPGQPGQAGSEGPMGLFGTLLGMLAGLHGTQERGLEKEVLDNLPLVTYDDMMFKNVEEESKTCPICLDKFENGNEVRFLWCIHRFHKNCVDQWLDKHTNCPVCKKDYSEIEKNFE